MADKKITSIGNKIGSWAFLIGVLLAIIVGFYLGSSALTLSQTTLKAIMASLVIIGILVGLFNVAAKEVAPFMMSGVVLIIASAFGAGIMSNITYAAEILTSLLLIFVPATIIVAIKNVYSLAKD